jgi:hypothetical protein
MRRLCCYSLSLPESGQTSLLTQLSTSIDSLRNFNSDVQIVLFAYDDLPGNFSAFLKSRRVRVWRLESYASRLARHSSYGWPYMCQYPLLHKYLNFVEISSLEPEQVLMLDCDTYFQHDVGRMFDKYGEPDLVAREEVCSRRSHHGYDTKMVDEDALARIGKRSGITPAPPFNTGVVLLNHGLWEKLAGLGPLLIQYAWRFFVWMAANPPAPGSEFGEGLGIENLREAWGSLGPADRFLALEFPSANRWIMDEVTLWMTVGHLPDIVLADFDRSDVAMNGEYQSAESGLDWVVCHYFSQNLEKMRDWASQKIAV